ncbi:MAG: mycothiol synthase [Acidimicrobiales bacterium]
MRHLDLAGDDGSAHVDRVPTGWMVELVGVEGPDAAIDRLHGAVVAVADVGGGLARLWVRHGDDATHAAAQALGLTEERSLHQLRRRLPVDLPWSLATRPFVVGQDERAWLEVNNRAFEWHPEQGGWTLDDLRERIAEPWFDPAGFLLHEEDGALLGFCWTKEHRDVEPPLGEIYVIAADPAAGRKGLGTALTLAGLDHLHRRGLDIGMLYVDGGNDKAMAMYDRLGFTVHHTDVAWTIEVAPR